jgi:hypothetical protein
MRLLRLLIFIVLVAIVACDDNETTPRARNFTLEKITVDGHEVGGVAPGTSIDPIINLTFSEKIDLASAEENIQLVTPTSNVDLVFSLSNNDSTIVVEVVSPLGYLQQYNFSIGADLLAQNGTPFGSTVVLEVTTTFDPSDKFERISESALLDSVQKKTFKYFWDFGHPVSGMARERNTSGELVTTGGTGFGLMSIIVGIERGFITRSQGVERLKKIIDFLATADRFHGAWPHWMNGSTGKVIPFSSNDNGGDLVETSFLIQGMITVRQYLNPLDATENSIITKINTLWQGVEWDWYTRGGQNVLYWHWSPSVDWAMNHQIRGHNETLITYVLAASSPTHSINLSVYQQGYARNGAIANGKTFYNTILPLGEDFGGPLFFAHYSFLGLDPRNLSDIYADYWQQNVNHTLINRSYAIANPKNYVGYSAENWGLTASDNHNGYSAHSPSNDLGVISPTAALSSFPYTAEYSMDALEFFYYKLGDRLWGEYGFKDAFNLTEGWFAGSYLAIDQGPIVVMIENHRTQLLWELFMSAPEVQSGLTKLGFNF